VAYFYSSITILIFLDFGKDRVNPEAIKLVPNDSKTLRWTISAIIFSATVPCFLASCMIVLELDPFSFILRHIKHPSLNNILVLTIKCFLCYYISHIGWYGILSVLLIILIQLHYGYFVISKCLNLAKDLIVTQMEDRNKKKTIKLNTQQFRKQVVIIREVLYAIKCVRLVLPLVDDALYLILPFLFLFGEIIFVSCNYATLKMYHSIPMPFFLTLPSLSFVIILLVQILFPFAASVFENSRKSLAFLKALKVVGTNKMWRRVIRATRLPRFNIGSMFYAKRSTKTTYFECWFNHTINALIFNDLKISLNC